MRTYNEILNNFQVTLYISKLYYKTNLCCCLNVSENQSELCFNHTLSYFEEHKIPKTVKSNKIQHDFFVGGVTHHFVKAQIKGLKHWDTQSHQTSAVTHRLTVQLLRSSIKYQPDFHTFYKNWGTLCINYCHVRNQMIPVASVQQFMEKANNINYKVNLS